MDFCSLRPTLHRRSLHLLVLLLLLWGVSLPLLGAIPTLPSESPWGNATQLHPGILHATLKLAQPRLMAVTLIRVDLHHPGIGLAVTAADPDLGKPMPDCPRFTIRTRRQSTGAFLQQCRRATSEGGRGLNLVFACNASPWTPWEKPFNHRYADGMGLLICDGAVVSPANGRPGLAVLKSGKVEFRDFPAGGKIDPQIHLAICGFQRILQGGRIIVQDIRELHPRMVWGVDKAGKYLYMAAIDGRQPGYSLGASLHECAQLLQYMGATEGLNMDGGGSTTMVTWDEQLRQPRLLNRPTKSGTYQRPVGASLGVYLRHAPGN